MLFCWGVTAVKNWIASMRQIHIFCDASERAYGSVAYLWTEKPWRQSSEVLKIELTCPYTVLLCGLTPQLYLPSCCHTPVNLKWQKSRNSQSLITGRKCHQRRTMQMPSQREHCSLTGQESRWNKGPKFLRQTTDHGSETPPLMTIDQDNELRKPVVCGLSISSLPPPDPQK